MHTIRRKALAIVMVIAAISFGALTFVPAAVATPATFTVNSVGDGSDANPGDGFCDVGEGECTLRAAIEEANANAGADTIEFNISGTGVHTITATTAMPFITDETHIDGYSQPGSAENTAVSPNPINSVITIELVDGIAGHPADMTAGIAFVTGAANSSLRGLSIHGFGYAHDGTTTALNVYVADSNITVAGSYIGVNADGTTVSKIDNDAGVSIDAPGTTFGGVNPEDRNILFSYSDVAQAAGISGGGDGTVIYGNYFGVAKDGVTDFTSEAVDANGFQGPFQIPINLVAGDHQIIGGPNEGEANLISGGTTGIQMNNEGFTIQGNLIGTDYTGHPNDSFTSGVGILTTPGHNNLIGGPNAGEGNIIAGVQGAGVLAFEFIVDNGQGEGNPLDIVPTGNTFIGNSIYDISVFNFPGVGEMNQGIDLALFHDVSNPADFTPDTYELRGPQDNDEGDVDGGPNGLINFPVLHSAVQTGSDLNVNFDLDAADSPSDTYRVDFYANDRATIFGYGPGQTYLGHVNVSPGEDLDANLDLGDLNVEGKSLSATTTAIDSTTDSGFGSTSEFALNVLVGSDSDFDADTIPDSIENAAPNDGDGNDDGIADSQQPTVSSFVSATSGKYLTFVTDGCYSNGYVEAVTSQSLGTDTGYDYPYGMTDFSLNCSRGDTVTIDKYIYDDYDSSASYSIRKFNPEDDQFVSASDIPDADPVVESATIGGENAIHLQYTITDGALGDDDGETNGVIVDPVGLATVHVDSQQQTNSGSSDDSSANSNGSAAGTDSTNSANGVLSSTGAHQVDNQTTTALWSLALGLFLIALTRMNRSTLRRLRKSKTS
jgi:CSLREA domain-containing protein